MTPAPPPAPPTPPTPSRPPPPPPVPAPPIQLRRVSKRHPGVVAPQPVDPGIHNREFFCLLGPSGCGKTTTLNLIGGFVEVSDGEILIEGKRADGIPPYKRNVNTVFQNYALFPHLNVQDNVGFGLKMAHVSGKESRPR